MEKLTSWWKKTTEKCFTEYNLTQNEDSSKPDRAWIRAWFVSNYNIYKIPGYFYRYMNDCFSKLKPLDESMGAWRKIQKAQSEKYDTTEQKAKKLANKIVIEDKISNLFTEFDPKARDHDLNKPEVFKELLQGFLSKQLNIPVEIITVRDYLIDNEMNYVFEISYQTFDNLILKKDYSRRLSTMGFIEDLFSLKLRKRIGEHISLLITFQSNDNGTIKNIEIEFEVGNSEGGSESFIINFQISDINQTTAVFDFFSCILKILAEIENPEFMAYMLTTIILAVNEYEVGPRGPLTAPDNKYQCLETGDYYLENLFISIFQKTIHNKELEKTYQENIIKMKSRYSKSYLQAINKLYQKILDYVRKCDQADEVLPSNHLLNESMDAFRKNRAKHNEDIQFTNPFSSFPPAFSRFSIEEQEKYLVDLIKTKFGRKLNASPRNHISFETKENNEDILNDNSVDIEYELRKENWKQRIGIVLFVEDFNPNSSNAEEYYNFYIGCTDLMECGKYGKCDFDTYRFTEKYADDPVMNQAGKIAWKQLISLQDIDNVSYFPRLQFTDKNAKYNLINFFRIVFSDEFNNLAYMITKNIISPYNEQLLTECKDKIESGKQPAIHLSTERGAEKRHIEMLIKALCKQLFGKQYDSVYYDKETISHWFAPEKFMDIYNSWIKGEDTSSFIPEIDLKKIADKFRVELKSVSKTSDNSAVSESMDTWNKVRKQHEEDNDGQDIRNGNKVVNGLIKSKEDMEISSRYNDGIDFDTAPESIRNMNRNPQIRQSMLRIFRNVVRECLDTHFGISNIKFMEITEQYSFSPMIVSFSYGERKYVFEVMSAIITLPQYQINIRISEKNETMEDGSGVYGYRMRGNAVEFSFDVDTKERYIFLDVILFIQSTFKILFDPVFHYNKFLSFIKIISNLEYRFHEEKDNEGSSPLELESRNFESQLVEMYFYCSFLKINKQIALNIKNNSFDRIREYFTKQPFNYFSFSDFSSEPEGAKVNANTFEHIKKGSFIMNEFSFLNKIVNRFEEQIKLNPNADMKKVAIEIMSEIMAELTQNDLKTIQVLSPERVNL